MIPRDPIEAVRRLPDRAGTVLLHSGGHSSVGSRYSIVAGFPREIVELHDRSFVISRDGRVIDHGVLSPGRDGFDLLDDRLGHHGGDADGLAARGAFCCPLALGYLGYELNRHIERLPRPAHAGPRVPDLWFGIFSAVVVFDHESDDRYIVAHDDSARERLAAALRQDSSGRPAAPAFGELCDTECRDDYRRKIARIHDYLRAGDCYQVNLARRLVASTTTPGDPFALYRALATHSPAEYGAYLRLADAAVISSSPEQLLSFEPTTRIATTRPIKGTRERSGRSVDDTRVADELTRDTKEGAEHLMIVDLERNDFGKIAELGSVDVPDFARVIALPGLFHLESRVRCRVRAEKTSADIIRAVFPGGSITGAPKLRAMEIIHELERARRGPYTGAIGVIDGRGRIELSVAIRTGVYTPRELSFYVGGGIVIDSDAEREFVETEEKAARWRRALADL